MNTRKYSKNQEKRVAKKLGGKVSSNSGATMFYKGDVSTQQFLIECKTATKEQQSFSIKKEWIEKNRQEAFAMGKPYSVLAFNFGGSALRNNENFYIIDENLFTLLKQYVEEGQNE